MKQFDISRFGALLKWHLMSNHRQILNIFFALTIGFFAMMLFFTQVLDFQVLDDGPSTIRLYQMRLEMSMMTGLFCIFICVLVSAARIFRNMKSTSQRITFLMLPASNFEKWLVRFLHATLFTFLLACLALVAADVVRMLIAPLWDKPFMSGVALLLKDRNRVEVPVDSYKAFVFLFMMGSTLLISHATYILGGALFRKSPFVLTTLVMFVLSVLVGQVLHDSQLMNEITLADYNPQTGLYISPWVWIAGTVNYLLALLFYWLSYKLFCRMQVINNKWLNL